MANSMSKVRVHCFSLSVDGYGAGPKQSLSNPMGENPLGIHNWVFGTKSFQQMHGAGGERGSTGVDNEFLERGFENIGSWILGRNMFGPIRGEWTDEEWQGWWGENPPYHCPVFVLTNFARAPITMEGGTTFHFVTEGIHNALAKAKEAAGEKDVRIGGGVSTLRQYLIDKLIDEMHIAISPFLFGNGENLFHGMDLSALGYEIIDHKPTDTVMHIIIAKR
jgi:dihydrofolate reductase